MKTENLTSVRNISLPIIERCKAGDSKAFHELYQMYSKAMFNVCLRMVVKREEAEDILQESFIDAFNNLQHFRGESSFGAWLKRIVVNRCINFLKKKKLELVEIENKNFIEEKEETEENEMDYTVKQIQQAVNDLADGFKVVLTMYLFEDYSHKEIAEALGISEATSKSQYSRAKERLKELLKTKEYAR